MKIIGYAYDADIHCIECTRKNIKPLNSHLKIVGSGLDENDIPEYLEDFEGNEVHPIFDIDENSENEHCGDCLQKLS